MTSTTPIRLRHLNLTPTGGIGNRLRAIASARRLCQAIGARCTVTWDWGDFTDFFAPLPDVTFTPARTESSSEPIRHQLARENPSPIRSVDVTAEAVDLISGTVFWGSHEAPIGDWAVLRPYLPAAAAHVGERVDRLEREHQLGAAIGMHIRRTDHANAVRFSPDRLFVAAARRRIASGRRIFLATDNLATERDFRERFPHSIITLPKRTELPARWPRPFSREATEDDLVELYALARTTYILGSYWSSYSYLAIVLNGSKQCEIVASPWVRLNEWKRTLRWWSRRLSRRSGS